MKIRSLQQVCHDLHKVSLIRELSGLLSAGQTCFLVGGAIRDAFLGRICNDFDFVTPFDPTCLAQKLARHLSGTWFFLDEKRRQSRIVVSLCDGQLLCDFGTLRSMSLFEDLSLRDFTVNATAMRIRADIKPDDFYDPLNGLSDLSLGQLAVCSERVLCSDPLRTLKGIRHCKVLHLTATEKTMELMRVSAPLLQRVAKERVRKEIGLLLNDEEPATVFRWLHVIGLAQAIFGEWIGERQFTVVMDSLETFGRNIQEVMASEKARSFLKIMQEEFEDGFSRQTTLTLGVILQGRPIGDVQRVISGLKLSRMTSKALLGYWSLASSKLAELSRLRCGFRGRFWWVSGLGSDPVGCLFFLACNTSEYRPELFMHVSSLVEEYKRAETITDLVDGNWLCQHLEMKPGPLVGEALHALRCEEIAGRVHSAEQAREFLRLRSKKSVDNS
ncbi:MAG: hypothetical protein AB7D06_15785 [Pedobacter sp.]